jgi:hypothetical protein
MKITDSYSLVNDDPFKLVNKGIHYQNFFGEKKEINSSGFRSDEFINKHEGTHILFSGCSVTSGTGLLEEEIWTKILYNKIYKEANCSGYFNLGIPASGLCDQVINMFKYFNSFGNPDFIFYMIPDSGRFYSGKKEFRNCFFSKEDEDLILFLYKQYYMMLESYCKTNNIKLFSFTYIADIQHNFKNNFKTFKSIDMDDLYNFVFVKNKEKNNLYTETARDNMHFGTAYHEYWSNFIYEIYKNNKNKN